MPKRGKPEAVCERRSHRVGNKVDGQNPVRGRVPEAFRQGPVPQKFHGADLVPVEVSRMFVIFS